MMFLYWIMGFVMSCGKKVIYSVVFVSVICGNDWFW